MSRIDITNLSSTIVPKSDQLNAEQLLKGPMTITVSEVRPGTGDDQPVNLHYTGDEGRPYKPCKTMRKVLVYFWGENGTQWVGKSMTLYNDPEVRFGGMEVGGIRISHLTDIQGDARIALTSAKGKKAVHEIKAMSSPVSLASVLAAIEAAHNNETMKAAKALVGLLNESHIEEAWDAYRAKVAELKSKAAPKPAEAKEPTVDISAAIKRINACATKDELDALMDQWRGTPGLDGLALDVEYARRGMELAS